jgi:hypothetical protein
MKPPGLAKEYTHIIGNSLASVEQHLEGLV